MAQGQPLASNYTTIRKPIFGNFRCNRYSQHQISGTSFVTCNIENICLATNGQFVLFHPSERLWGHQKEFMNILNSKPWLYIQGRVTTSNRGQFQAKVMDADLVLEYKNTNSGQERIVGASSITGWSTRVGPDTLRKLFTRYDNENEQSFTQDGVQIAPIALDSNFTYFTSPTFALKRFDAGQLDHFLVDNMFMVVSLMMSYYPISNSKEMESLVNHTLLYLDDVFDKDASNDLEVSDPSTADEYSLTLSSLITRQPPLQLCETQSNYYSIEKLPCRNVGKNITSKWSSRDEPLTLKACFSQFLVGMTEPFHNNFHRRQSVAVTLRQLAYHNLKIRPLPHEENDNDRLISFLDSKPVRVVIHRKGSSYQGPFIVNVEEISKALQEQFSRVSDTNSQFHQLIALHSRIEVEFFELSKTPSLEDVKYFSTVDVFITDSGSAAYYSIFMRADTSVIVAPECTSINSETTTNGYTNRCESSVTYQNLKTLPSVQVIDYMEFGDISKNVQCQKRDVSVKDPSICDPILNSQIIAENVVPLLTKRFLKSLN